MWEGGLAKIDICRRGGGRGQAKIDVYNFCLIRSPFEEIYDIPKIDVFLREGLFDDKGGVKNPEKLMTSFMNAAKKSM